MNELPAAVAAISRARRAWWAAVAAAAVVGVGFGVLVFRLLTG